MLAFNPRLLVIYTVALGATMLLHSLVLGIATGAIHDYADVSLEDMLVARQRAAQAGRCMIEVCRQIRGKSGLRRTQINITAIVSLFPLV